MLKIMVPVNVVVQTVGFSGCKEEEDYYISWLSSERRDNLELVKARFVEDTSV